MSKSWLSRRPADGSKWLHPADSLLKGQVSYQVKLFGTVDASGTKGIEVVRDAMQKTKFNRQLLKADGVKSPKVDLIISVDNVVVRNVKTKVPLYQFPLQQLSYCADDKAARRLFAFVARDNLSNSHKCFVFDSEKCAEEITLTIGQAFELAYQKFLEEKPEAAKTASVGEPSELRQENISLKQRISQLEGFIVAHGLQIPPCSDFDTSKNNGVSDNDRPRLGSAGSGASNNTEPERYSSLNLDPHILIESHSFSSLQPSIEENGAKTLGSIPVLTPPPTVPARNMNRSSSDLGQAAKNGTNGTISVPPAGTITVPSSTNNNGTTVARPRPQAKLTSLSETNPFRDSDFPPPSNTAKTANSPPQECLTATTWTLGSTPHAAALADFDPLSLKTAN